MYEEITIIENTKKAQNEYGHSYGSGHYIITEEHIKALLEGKQLAFGINDEYVTFLSMSKPIED